MREIFIYNRQSGKGIKDKKLNNIINYILSIYPNTTLCPTYKKGDAKTITEKYIRDTYLIFVLGGDGTIHDIVSAIINSNYNPTICIIPNGTMNDLAHSLHIPRNYKKAISLSRIKKTKPCNVIQINDNYAIYASAIGRFSSTSYETKQILKNKYGKLSYFCTAIKDIWHYPPIKLNIEINNTTITDYFSLLLMCIGEYVAGFRIGKNCDTTTSAKLVLIKEKPNKFRGSLSSAYSIAKLFLFGIHKADRDNLTTVIDFNTLTIRLDQDHPIVIDGEKYISNEYNIRLIPKQIRFLTY